MVGAVCAAVRSQGEALGDHVQAKVETNNCEMSALALVDELLAELEYLQHRADVAIRKRSAAAGNAQVLVGQAQEETRTLQAEVEATKQSAEVGAFAAAQACMLRAERERLRKLCATESGATKTADPCFVTAAGRCGSLVREAVPLESTATTHQKWTGPISLSTFLSAAPEERCAARLAAAAAATGHGVKSSTAAWRAQQP